MTMKENNKIALITGANRGIGFETAKQLGSEGFTVLIGARNKKNGEEAEAKLKESGIDAYFIEIDVNDQSSIERAAKEINEKCGRLDVLVNNVGAAFDMNNVLEVDPKILKDTFDINFFSMLAVTKAMLPLIHKSTSGRIVNMSSELGSLTRLSDPSNEFYNNKVFSYNASKTLVNQFTVHLAYELKDSNIKVNSACPGFTATALNNFMGTRSVEQATTIIVKLATLAEDGPTGGFFDENGVIPW